jgi:hypothetical protein
MFIKEKSNLEDRIKKADYKIYGKYGDFQIPQQPKHPYINYGIYSK